MGLHALGWKVNTDSTTPTNTNMLFTTKCHPVCVFVFFTQAVERVLYPHLPAYWANLQAVLDDYSVSNAQVKADGHKVYGAILVSTVF